MTYKRTEFEWFQHYAATYIRYIKSYKKLEDAYDQLVHPQKRPLLLQMLESTMVRMCEIKHELVKNNMHADSSLRSDYVNLDEVLMNLKLTPQCLEIPFPRYFHQVEAEALARRNQLIDKQLMSFNDNAAPWEEQIKDILVEFPSNEVAIRLIQKNERGRQGIERAMIFKFTAKEEKKKAENLKLMQQGIEVKEESSREDAVLVIQKYYRGYLGRFEVDGIRNEQFIFLGMKKDEKKEYEDDKKKYLEKRKKMQTDQEENYRQYEQSVETLRQEVKAHETPDMKEQALEERRKFIMDFLEMHEFSRLPNSISEFYTRKDVMVPLTPEQKEMQRIEEEKKSKDKKKKKDQKKAGKGKGKQSERDEFLASNNASGPAISDELTKIQNQIEKFQQDWANMDETKNFKQEHDVEMAKALVRPDVKDEIKTTVDEILEIELDNLRAKYGLKPKPKTKPRKPKKGGKGKSGKKKKKKVPGATLAKDRDPNDLLTELAESGVLRKLVPCRMSDYLGDHNNLGSLQERQNSQLENIVMPDPSYAQIRQVITEYIGIPLGSPYAKKALPLLSYFLFFGPLGSGKTMMTRALSTECDAIVFDISPSIIDGKFPDRNSLLKMIYMVFTCAKQFQPAIIYIDECELIFPGGKKKKVQGPIRLKKILQDMKKCKYLEPTDRVVVIGNTDRPNEANMKELKVFFEKKLYFPFPNYSTRKLLFETFIKEKGMKLPEMFPLSTLAHITEGFTPGSFKIAIDKVITERRKLHVILFFLFRNLQLKENPLKLQEFIVPLSTTYCILKGKLAPFQKFNDDVTGLQDKRNQKKDPDKDEKGKGKGKGKGKKK